MHHVLSEIIQGGLVLETNINEISLCGELVATMLCSSFPSPRCRKQSQSLGRVREPHHTFPPYRSWTDIWSRRVRRTTAVARGDGRLIAVLPP